MKELLKKAFNYIKSNGVLQRIEVVAPGETMELVAQGRINETDYYPTLTYYTTWMAYFSYQWVKWQAIYEYLENLYTHERAKRLSTKLVRGETKYRERQVETELSDLTDAMTNAKSRYFSYKQSYLTAEAQRDLVSRFITLESNELKTIGRQ